MRNFINIIAEAAEQAAQQTQQRQEPPQPHQVPLLILVHPGSACGSAEFNLGKYEGRACRDGLVSELNGWRGAIIVVDGELSEELTYYPTFNSAINGCLARAKAQGFVADRVHADDNCGPGWPRTVAKFVAERVPKGTEAVITGAWYFTNNVAGCVNGVYDALSPFCRCEVSDMALIDPDSREDDDVWDDEEEDEGN